MVTDIKPWRLVKDPRGARIIELNDHGATPLFVCRFAPGRERSARQVVRDHNELCSQTTLDVVARLYPKKITEFIDAESHH